MLLAQSHLQAHAQIDCPMVEANVDNRNGVSGTTCQCEDFSAICASTDAEKCYTTQCAGLIGGGCIPKGLQVVKVCYIKTHETTWTFDSQLRGSLDQETLSYQFTKGVANVTSQEIVRILGDNLATCENFYDGVRCNSCEFCDQGGITFNCSNILPGASLQCISGIPVAALVLYLIDQDALADSQQAPP